MAVPKRRLSRSNTWHRRARWTAAVPTLLRCPCPLRGLVAPHRVRAHCNVYRGVYRGRRVLGQL